MSTERRPAVPPHGGTLVDLLPHAEERAAAEAAAVLLPRVSLDDTAMADLECIVTGAYSPLEGFMDERDYHAVVHEMRLHDGTLWSLPVTLPVSEAEASRLHLDEQVALTDSNGTIVAAMTVQEIFRPDRRDEARQVYGTTDERHAGVAMLYARAPVHLAGRISGSTSPRERAFERYRLTPARCRTLFAERDWRTIVAFQTRNPIHRAHEYITKTALENVDGLLLHPLVGATKSDDVPVAVRMRCYEVLMNSYYPADRTVLGVYPAAMRYAGPREAILHAISRQNYGCSHFIVGRDHAGVGSYYGPYDAQRIFEQLAPDDLAIRIMAFEHAFFCRTCDAFGSAKTCPHPSEHHVHLSGTSVRDLLRRGEGLPTEFARPEVAALLTHAYGQAVEATLVEPVEAPAGR